MSVPWWGWAATIAVIAAILGAELAVGIRRGAREVSVRAAAVYTAVVVAASAAFGLGVAWLGGGAAAGQFFAGWLTEYSLSLDNLFIFVLLIGGSAVPAALHSRVLLLGVATALVLRGAFIAAGAAAISRFSWVLYIFGAVLIATAIRLARGSPAPAPAPATPAAPASSAAAAPSPTPGSSPAAARPAAARPKAADSPQPGASPTAGSPPAAGDSPVVRLIARFIPVSPDAASPRLITRSGGRRMATPLLFLIVAVGITDVIFAVDSIPAIFGLTRDPYLVFTASALALLGLRQLYFLISGLLRRLVHLSAGLAVILAFIGFKLIAEALAASGVHHLGPVPVPHIGTPVSLGVIAGVLATVTLTSLLATRRAAAPGPAPDP